ncbi:MAG: flavodoxin family protein [Spirochaetia bacterium]|nr:flavodoxin family protein [Spirochaetia bacterium]
MKKILVINGHPNKESYNNALKESYIKGARSSGFDVEDIQIGDLKFEPNLFFGYTKRIDLEPDLEEAWQKILRAEHIVWIHPLWWGGVPAIMKGFIDRIFLPGRAFAYRPNSIWWDRLLKGRSARIICTSDQPYLYYWLVNGKPAINQLKKMTLEFSGITPVKVSFISPIKRSTVEYRNKWLKKIESLGKSGL